MFNCNIRLVNVIILITLLFVAIATVLEMEEEELPSCPASPHADLKIHPMFDSTGTKLFLVFFDLRNCSIVICGDCVDALKVDGRTPKKIGGTVLTHWTGPLQQPTGSTIMISD